VKNNETRVYERKLLNKGGYERILPPNSEKYFWNAENTGLLVINASIHDEGIFSCRLIFRKNEKDEDSEFSSYTNLAVLRRPKLLKAELKQNYIEFSEESGLKDIAVCEYDPGRPAATVRWVDGLDGSALPSNFFKTTLTRTQKNRNLALQMIPDKKFNNKYIKCTLKHALLNVESDVMTLNVTFKPEKPNIIQDGDRLFCAATGNPVPAISWEVESENDDIKTKILDSDSVKIRYLGDRKVNYTCTASNMMGVSAYTISNGNISMVEEIREKTTLISGIIIGAVSLIFIVSVVVCHIAWKSTKEKNDAGDSGWSEPLQITMTGHPGGDTGQFIYRVPLSHDNSKLMDFRGHDTTTDSGTCDDSHDSMDPHDFEPAFVRSDSILQDHRNEYQLNQQPRFKFHEGYHSEHDLLNSSTEQPSQIV